MDKRLVIFLLLLGIAGLAAQAAPEWLWATSAGGDDYDIAEDIVCDAAGNVYVTGYYKGAIQFGDFYTDSGGDSEIFVVKLDAAGNYLWAQHAGSPYEDSAEDIAIDAAGNVYITGWFNNVATFGSLGVISHGAKDIFLAKLSPNGEWLWVWGAGGDQGDSGLSITVAPNGHCFVAGSFYEEAFFGDHTIECDYMNDMFIAETNSDGNWTWVETAGGPNTEACWDLAADGDGNCYLTGYISDDSDFGSIHMDTEGPYDSFVAKINDGSWSWAIQPNCPTLDVANGIALDPAGNLYVAGYFKGLAAFGGSALTSYGEWDIYLAKVSPSGNWLWAVQAGGTDYDTAYDVALDPAGNCYVTGSIIGSVQFGSLSYPSGNSCDALFIAKCGGDGNWLWARRTVSWQTAVGYSLAVDATGRSFVSGYFFDQVDFGDIILESNGSADLLIAALAAAPVAVDDPSSPAVITSLGVSPNPFRGGTCIRYELASHGPAEIVVYNLKGQLVREIPQAAGSSGSHELAWDGTDGRGIALPSGIYLVRLSCGSETRCVKAVLSPAH